MPLEVIIDLATKLVQIVLSLIDPSTAHGLVDTEAARKANELAEKLEDDTFGPKTQP